MCIRDRSQDNLVEYYSNIGVNVVKLDENDLREIYEFMSELDSVAVRYSARHPDREELCNCLLYTSRRGKDYSQNKKASNGISGSLCFFESC